MGLHHIWITGDPVAIQHLQRANEERSAAFYAALKSIGRGFATMATTFRSLRAQWQRRQRKLAAIRELNALDDYNLKDIGVSRGEIEHIAEAHADGVEEPRPQVAAYNEHIAQKTGHWPAWVRQVVHGTRLTPRNAPDPAKATHGSDHRRSA